MNVGERVGDYEVVQILGAGGMGQVYKVRNVFSDRIEAMKVLLPNLGGDTELAERFQREIKLQATLDHPNIARLNTAQLVGNQLIMVMEYVEGESVEALLHQGPVPLPAALSCIVQVLDALAYAHARGVVHRDIKPANIMLTPQGLAKLMDFGIAKMEADRRLTQTGHAVGSLFYMSPEQIKGVTPDARSDIYSLGITMYEMVTGRRPFEGTSDFSIMAAHLEQKPVAPIEVIPGVPSDLSDIILMAIAKDPGNRFQSAQAFQGALRSLPAAQNMGGTLLRPASPPPLGAPSSAGRAVPPTVVNAPAMMGPPPPLPQTPIPQMPAPPIWNAPTPQFAPQPQFTAPAASYGPPPTAYPGPSAAPPKSGRRGLYMALGSMATLLVLAAAVVEGPKLWHSGASVTIPDAGNQTPVSNAGQAADPPPGAQNGAPATDPGGNPVTAPVQSPVVQAPVVQSPVVQAPATPAQTPPVPAKPVPVRAAAPQAPPVQQPTVQVQPPPVQAQPPAPAPPPVQAQTPPAVAGPSAQQMNELRQEYNLLSVRVGAAKSGLGSIQQQMRRQGLDLRGDILEAESRMDYQMKEAMDSIRAGDSAAAKNDMQMAERALETVEKFLGR